MEPCSTDHHPRPHDHPEHPDSGTRKKAHQRLKKAFIVALILFLAEIFGSIFSGSLALLADAFHVLSDLIALSVTLISARLAAKPRNSRHSYGFYRLEVLAALFNGLLLSGLAITIVYQAWFRLSNPVTIQAQTMLVVAVIGLIANLVMVRLLHGPHTHNLNLRGAYLHILGDTLASVGVVSGAILILWTGEVWIDTAVSIFVACLILIVSGRFIIDAANVLLEGAPKHMNPDQVKKEILESFPIIEDIHDFHLWEITSHLFALTAHIKAAVKDQRETRELIDGINRLIREKYGIGHTTFQVEPTPQAEDS